jgi:hypothetical protein
MAFKSSYWNKYPGVPGLIYKELTDYGRYKMSLEERQVCLHKIYAYLRGALPERKGVEEDDMPRVQMLLNIIGGTEEEPGGEFKKTDTILPPEGAEEGVVTFTEDMIKIRATFRGIFEMETEIIAITKVLDSIRPEQVDVGKANE